MSHPSTPDDGASHVSPDPAEPGGKPAEPGGKPAEPGGAAASGGAAGGAEGTGPTPQIAGPDSEPAKAPATFTERHRVPVGAVAVLLCLAVAAFFAVAGPAGAERPGALGTALRWGTPAIWVLLAGVAAAWTMRVRREVVNRMGFVVLGAYLVYLIVRAL
ncbi:hypothetical protein [Pseudactinotalea sp. Z1748]|uniref:hypothetical protein n=1 Tax=Pseudactinotalea sp. Z1748 TaxID=3413027 RepID=UPI003C7EC41F